MFVSKLQKFHWDEFVPLTLPFAMFAFNSRTSTFHEIFEVFFVWTCIVMSGSLFFNVHAVASSHHAPPMVHEGDEFESLDFGIYQLGAVFDRTETNSNLIMTLAHFGHHSLHHMFPSLDHSLLPQLQDTFFDTCMEFDVELKKFSFLDGFVGYFQQLSRTETMKCDAFRDKKITFSTLNWKDVKQFLNFNFLESLKT
jgi:fatty acid desaturase